uniref:Uncharacterized protein n=1 Tax=Populus trichocarpa TaxID=3694 RepID=A0A2K1Y402_POPTR
MRSKTGTSITIVRLVKDRSVAVGIMKPDAIVLSLLAPCMVKNVEYCASTMAYSQGTSLAIDNIKVPVVRIEFLLLELVTAFMGQGSMISFHGLHIPRSLLQRKPDQF